MAFAGATLLFAELGALPALRLAYRALCYAEFGWAWSAWQWRRATGRLLLCSVRTGVWCFRKGVAIAGWGRRRRRSLWGLVQRYRGGGGRPLGGCASCASREAALLRLAARETAAQQAARAAARRFATRQKQATSAAVTAAAAPSSVGAALQAVHTSEAMGAARRRCWATSRACAAAGQALRNAQERFPSRCATQRCSHGRCDFRLSRGRRAPAGFALGTCSVCGHSSLLRRGACGGSFQPGTVYYGLFSQQRSAGVLVERASVDGVYHYLFAVPPETRPDAQAFEVRTKDDDALSVRACFMYLTNIRGLKLNLREHGPYASTRLFKAHGREVLPELEACRTAAGGLPHGRGRP